MRADFEYDEYHQDLVFKVLKVLCKCIRKTVIQNYVQIIDCLQIPSRLMHFFLVMTKGLNSIKDVHVAQLDCKVLCEMSSYFLFGIEEGLK